MTHDLASLIAKLEATPTIYPNKDLIESFVDSVSVSRGVDDQWQDFIASRREAQLAQIIDEERLHPDAARAFVDGAFRDGVLQTSGTVGQCG